MKEILDVSRNGERSLTYVCKLFENANLRQKGEEEFRGFWEKGVGGLQMPRSRNEINKD